VLSASSTEYQIWETTELRCVTSHHDELVVQCRGNYQQVRLRDELSLRPSRSAHEGKPSCHRATYPKDIDSAEKFSVHLLTARAIATVENALKDLGVGDDADGKPSREEGLDDLDRRGAPLPSLRRTRALPALRASLATRTISERWLMSIDFACSAMGHSRSSHSFTLPIKPKVAYLGFPNHRVYKSTKQRYTGSHRTGVARPPMVGREEQYEHGVCRSSVAVSRLRV
jgi:hypothetical protein